MLVEAAGGLLALALVEAVLLPMAPETSLAHGAMVFFSSFALGLGLMGAAFIDLDHMYIPDSISMGAIVLGIATFWLRPPLTWTESLAASAAGFLLVWLVFGVLYRLVRGRTGMGLGDAKLLAVAGAWFGWKGMVFALLAGAVQGTIAALVVLMVRGRIDEPEAVRAEREALLAEVAALEDERERAEAEAELLKDPIFESVGSGPGGARIAFGPFLVLGIIEYLLVGDTLIHSYVTWLGY
jgi:leader peptidase (prepilin peptidase)/N-methyltransferase